MSSILSFFRRTKSRYADDKAVDDFTHVVEQTGLLSEELLIDEAAKIIANDNPSVKDIERLGEMLNGLPRL